MSDNCKRSVWLKWYVKKVCFVSSARNALFDFMYKFTKSLSLMKYLIVDVFVFELGVWYVKN
jgi:hypothetical protein